MNKDDVILKEYYHIDNGGITVSVDKYSNIELTVGFFGYSSTTVKLMSSTLDKTTFHKHGDTIDFIIGTLTKAKLILRDLPVE